jgi:hypothetical protein
MSNSKLLVSGNGMGNPEASTALKYAVIDVVIGIACFIAAFYIQSLGDEIRSSATSNFSNPFSQLANTYRYAEISPYITIGYYTMIITGISCIIWGVCLGNSCAKKIKTTNVNIYEDKVSGAAVDKDFSMTKLMFMGMGWGKAKLTYFDIAFNQITSVHIEDNNAIVINASGANYKCFVSNCFEILSAINNKIRNG